MEREVPPGFERSYASLLRDMRLALLSEIGARSIYDHLGRRVQEPELRRLLARLNQEGADNVARLQALIVSMGGRPRRTSFRRRALARLLALGSTVTGRRLVLRICHDAEETVARWYGSYAHFLLTLGDLPRAQEFERLRQVKRTHAQALAAWIANMRRR